MNKKILTVDDLSFTSRDPQGRIRWWDIEYPKTTYWPVHEMLGRAYALELLDLIQNAKEVGKPLYKHDFGFIAAEIARQNPPTGGVLTGFFNTISEALITGEVER
jgi:hypothetical protein